nr:hypothetical protein Itr_chr08CG21650 [Ipomoea trifida]
MLEMRSMKKVGNGVPEEGLKQERQETAVFRNTSIDTPRNPILNKLIQTLICGGKPLKISLAPPNPNFSVTLAFNFVFSMHNPELRLGAQVGVLVLNRRVGLVIQFGIHLIALLVRLRVRAFALELRVRVSGAQFRGGLGIRVTCIDN